MGSPSAAFDTCFYPHPPAFRRPPQGLWACDSGLTRAFTHTRLRFDGHRRGFGLATVV
jgi:hypothetical protein